MKKIKTYLVMLIAFIVIGAGTYGYIYVNDLKDQVAHWKNEFAKEQGLVELKDGLFEQQALVLKEVEVESEKLRKRADETDRTIVYYQQVTLEYEVKIGLLESYAFGGDTVFVPYDTSMFKPRDEDRQFRVMHNNEIEIAGIFQISPPYNIFIGKVNLHLNMEMTLSQTNDETWFLDIDTNSEYLKVTDINVQVIPLPTRFSFYISPSIVFNGFNLDMYGIDLRGGIMRGNFGISVGVTISDAIHPNAGVVFKF